MADNIPNPPPGAVPTKKTTGRVQPKKETVRINLPPKPSAAPTIKMPTLPPGGPSGAAPIALPSSAPSTAAPVAPPPAPRGTSAPVAQRSAPAPSQQRPAPAPARAATLGPLDTGLAIAAAVAGLVAVGSVVYLGFFILQ